MSQQDRDRPLYTKGTQKVMQEIREKGQTLDGNYDTVWTKEKNMITVLSLVASQKQEYVRSHYTNVAIEVDGRKWFVPVTALVPSRSKILTDASSSDTENPLGTRVVAGG